MCSYFRASHHLHVVRGTLQIIWSCVATLFASTYTVLHLNIREQADGRDVGVKGTLKWWWKGLELPDILTEKACRLDIVFFAGSFERLIQFEV